MRLCSSNSSPARTDRSENVSGQIFVKNVGERDETHSLVVRHERANEHDF
jgi:hypothetical protein